MKKPTPTPAFLMLFTALASALALAPRNAEAVAARGSYGRICTQLNIPEANKDNARKNFKENLKKGLEKLSAEHRQPQNKLPESVGAQGNFLNQALKLTTDVCDIDLLVSKKMTDLGKKLGESAANNCQHFENMNTLYSELKTNRENLEKALDSELKKLKENFKSNARINRVNLDQFSTATAPELIAKKPALENEFVQIWGSGLTTASLNGPSDNFLKSHRFKPDGLLVGLVYKLEQEKAYMEVTATVAASHAAKLQGLTAKCVSAGDAVVQTAGGGSATDVTDTTSATSTETETDTNTDTDTSPGSDGNGATPGAGDGDGDPDGAKAEAEARLKEIEANRKSEADLAAAAEAERIEAERRRAATETQGPSWMSQNKDLLIIGGVGAAAVVGAIIYKNNQDKQEQKEKNTMYTTAGMVAANQRGTLLSTSTDTTTSASTGSTSSSSDTYTDIPSGSTLSVTSVPGSAKVGESVSEIEVGLLNPSGVRLSNNSTVITVSCAAPSPCNIAGTLTATTSGGKAKFNDIRFTAPTTGVRLQFNSPGFSPVVSTSTFDVTE